MLERCHTFRFDLHNLIRGEVSGPRWLLAPVIHELSSHEIEDTSSDPDLKIILQTGGAARDSAEGHETLLRWRGSHLMASWQAALMEKESGGLFLHVAGNRLTRFIVAKWLVEPAVRVVALKKGLVMTHAAALSDGKRALLVSGPGGAGKTTWTLHWLQAGHPYLADDFSIVNGGECLPYLTPLRLGFMNVLQNEVLKDMQTSLKIEAAARTMLRRATGGRVKLYLKAPLHQAVPAAKVSGPVPVAGALFLDPQKEGQSSGRVSTLSAKDFAKILSRTDGEEMHGFGGNGELPVMIRGSAFRKRQEELLTELLGDAPCLSVAARPLPERAALSSVKTLLDYLQKDQKCRDFHRSHNNCNATEY
ncbi:MAG: hypothetical protein R6V10_15920 [bacterium]